MAPQQSALAAVVAALLVGGPRVACCSDGALVAAEGDACSSAAGCTEEDEAPPTVMLLQQGLRRQRGALGSRGRTRPRPVSLASAFRPRPMGQAFVQLFEWSWDDVAQECEDWLGPKGFSAVLVSPPNEHIVGDGWYTRYQPVSYNLTSRSGSEEQFVSMVRRCRGAGVGVYADAVFNHCAAQGGVGVGGSSFGYRRYPMYEPQDFHHADGDEGTNCGVSDYQDRHNIQTCDLQGMPDLCTSCSRVQERVAAYLNRLADLGVAGFRVDAAKHMDAAELGTLLAKVNSSLYRFQEVQAAPGEAVQAPPYLKNGPVTEFGFAATVAAKFASVGLLRGDLAKVGEEWGLMAGSSAVVFVDDHDTQRSGAAKLTHKSGSAYDLASVFMLAYPYGYPKVMSSYYFEDSNEGPPGEPVHGQDGELRCGVGQPWVCEHRRPSIANMVAWRRAAAQEDAIKGWTSDGERLAFCRGKSACVALNMSPTPWSARLEVSVPAGDYCDVASSDTRGCPRVRVEDDETATVEVPPMGVVAFHIDAMAVEETSDADMQDSMPL